MRPIGDWSMSMTLSIMLQPFQRVERGRVLQRAIEPPRHRLVERIDDQGRFAAAGNAGDAGEQAERNIRRDIAQIIAARADQPQLASRVRLAALFRRRDLHAAGEIGAGERILVGHDVGRGSLRHDLAAMHAGAGADVDDIIGGEDGVLVMLDHDHRIAEVAQPPQGFQQPGIVALVQPDRGLVQHVEHAGQAGADLRGEADALAFAARQACPSRATG